MATGTKTRSRKGSTKPKGKAVTLAFGQRKTSVADINHSGSTRDEKRSLIIFAGIYLAGILIHRALEVYGQRTDWIVTVLCIASATGLVVWRLWLMMGPRKKNAREDMAMAVSAAGMGLALTVLIGWNPTWLIVYATFGVAVVVVYLLAESRRVRGRGDDGHFPSSGLDAESLGLAPGTVVRPRGDSDGEVVIDHAEGEDVTTVQANLARWESRFRLRAGTLLARVGVHRGQTIVRPVDTTALDRVIPYPVPKPPSHVSMARSIGDPLDTGVWADGKTWYTKWGSHSMTMGMTDSGKTTWALVKVTQMLTCGDVCLLWCDPVKGVQSAGPVLGGVTWGASTMAEAKAMVQAIVRAIPARTAELYRVGKYTKWVPEAWSEHRIPLIYVQFEEAAWLVDNGKMVEVAERARSAGIFFDMSLQRASHSRMDTDVRANLDRGTCLRVKDIADAGFCLTDRVLDAGARPDMWSAHQQGMLIADAADTPDDRLAMPIRGYLPTRNGAVEDLDVLAEVVTAHAHVRAVLDPVTEAAFGPAYGKWVEARAGGIHRAEVADEDGDSDPDDDGGDELRVEDIYPAEALDDMPDIPGYANDDDEPDDDEEPPVRVSPFDDTYDNDTSADDTDLGDFEATRMSTEERNERFQSMLAARWERGVVIVAQAEMSREWHDIEGGGGRPWPYMRLGRLARQYGPDGQPLVVRDEQDPSLWHINSDPHTWSADALTTTGSDDDED
jgi:hypothetical protein